MWASTDLNAVLATGPRCAVYNAMADKSAAQALEDYRRRNLGGRDQLSSASGPVFLQYPWQVIPDESSSLYQDAARAEIQVCT